MKTPKKCFVCNVRKGSDKTLGMCSPCAAGYFTRPIVSHESIGIGKRGFIPKHLRR